MGASPNDHLARRLVAPWRPVNDWTTLGGRSVEFYQRGRVIDSGTVESVTADGTILWLRMEGAEPRRIVLKENDVCARVTSTG